ncbi:hypothetical protein H072_1076 [Dactylellina haptotyla CBS 200.50]|uniref:N-acetyltransferase domain-containing protein n=1 Tax=Dactylellina haptotyla (strain CBS 200.50) TaxID=1284197 RepID=S8CB70_DACHA|nr:hypothetical protein H072_1076 [Dactylellina haptotyla CBS 200.50]
MSISNYEAKPITPSADDYFRLRQVAGLSSKSREAIAVGLPNTLYAVTVYFKDDSSVVGMGRVIGDGGLFAQVVDIAVEPKHQGLGVGKTIVQMITDWLKANLPKGAYVSLLADGEAYRLYEKFGFELTAPASVGMALRL